MSCQGHNNSCTLACWSFFCSFLSKIPDTFYKLKGYKVQINLYKTRGQSW